ncbi:MAG: AAA family ATPase [Candidatus Micrarchaeia archaeon]
MIDFIELRNWKTHENTKLSFAKGTNVLIGQMGSGKSSVMDAISYALFGVFPALQHRRVSASDLIKNIPEQKEFAEVRLGLSIGGSSYIIERRIELSGGASARVLKNGNIEQTQPQRVNEYIENLLKLDYDLFSRAIYSEQNNLDYFLELRSGERKDTIDELLGLDKFALAEDNTISLIHRIEDLAKEQESAASSFDKKKLEEQISEAEIEIGRIKIEVENLEFKKTELQVKVDELNKLYKELQEKNAKKINLEKELKSSEARIEFLEREAKKIESMSLSRERLEEKINEMSEKLKKMNQEAKDLEEKERSSNRNAARLESEVKKAEEEIKERDVTLGKMGGKKIEDYNARYEEVEKEVEKFEKELAAARAKKEEVEKYIEDLSKHISKCPVCERELSEELRLKLLEDKKKIVKEAEDKIDEYSKKIPKYKEVLKNINAELNSFLLADEKLKGFAGLDEKLAKAKEELKSANELNGIARKKLEEIRKEIDASTKELTRFEEMRKELEKLDSYKKELSLLKEGIKKTNAELAVLAKEVNDELLDKAQKELNKASSELSSTIASLSASKKALADKEKELNDKKDTLKHIENLIKDAEAKKKVAEELVKFRNALSETQGLLRSKLISSINHIMSEIWPELYPYGDYVDIRLDASKDDYVLEVKILKNGSEEWKPVENIASGGERSIACLAMRVAFALVLVPNLKWLILDEPTHNIDEQGIAKFIRVFNETLPRIVEQIFLITHDEMLKQASSSKTYLLSRDKASHGSTIVEEL